MIRLALAAALLASGSAALAAERSFPAGAFDRIALGGSPDVTVTTGRAIGVRATGSDKALDRLDIRVEDGVLKIGTKRGVTNWSWGSDGRVTIAVTVPMVRGVDIGGSGSVTVDRVKVPAFVSAIGGSGSIRIAALDVQTARFSVAGSGSVAASGQCRDASLDVAGSGDIRLGALRCATLNASIAGSGGVEANATQTASLSVTGSGDIRVRGGARCSISKHGSGSAVCSA